MKIIIKNFLNSLCHYKLASALNILGLSVAFAAFTIIMIQVRYDLSFNRQTPYADRAFRISGFFGDETGGGYSPMTSTRLVEAARNIPGVEKAGVWSLPSPFYWTRDPDQSDYNLRLFRASLDYDLLSVFNFEFIKGDTVKFRENRKLIMPESLAKGLFPGESAVGKYLKHDQNKIAFEIIAVYRDFPENSMLDNVLYTNMPKPGKNDNWGNWSYFGFLLLSPQTDKAEVENQLSKVYKGAENVYQTDFRLVSLPDLHFDTEVAMDLIPKVTRAFLRTLIMIAFLIVLIAAINFVNFSTSLAPVRMRNINTQKVLGGTNAGIRLNLIFEAVGIVMLSFAISVGIVYLLSLSGLRSLLTADISPSENWEMIGWSGLIALVTGVFAGIYPAFYMTSFPIAMALKGSFGNSPSGRKIRTFLISFQYVISFVLILSAIYIRVQNKYMIDFPIGFEKSHVVAVNASYRVLKSSSEKIQNALRENPRVKEIGFTDVPLVTNLNEIVRSYGDEYKGQKTAINILAAQGNLVDALGLTIVEGRDATDLDREKDHNTVLVNETARKKYDFDLNTLFGYNGHKVEVVGIVNDFNFKTPQSGIEPLMIIYPGKSNQDWYAMSNMYIKIENNRIPETLDFIRKTMDQFDDHPAEKAEIYFLDEWINNRYESEQKVSSLISVFSLLTIFISIMGVFGLILFETNIRRKEIGIRKINGATIGEILLMFNKTFLVLSAVCFAIAVPIALYFLREWKSGFTYQSPTHFWIFPLAYGIILAITVVTVTFQSYKTATENPVNSIRTE